MLGGRKVRSNKGKKRGSYGPRTGKTRSGKRFRTVTNTRKVGRKTRSNKGKKRTPYGPRTGKTRSGRKFRGGNDFNCLSIKDEKTCNKACDGKYKICVWNGRDCTNKTKGKVENGKIVAANDFSGFNTAVNTKSLRESCSNKTI